MRPVALVMVKERLQGPVDRPRLFLSRHRELVTASSLLLLLHATSEELEGWASDDMVDSEGCGLGVGMDFEGVSFFGILKFLTADEFGKQLRDFEGVRLDEELVVLEFRVQLRTRGFDEVMMWLRREWFC